MFTLQRSLSYGSAAVKALRLIAETTKAHHQAQPCLVFMRFQSSKAGHQVLTSSTAPDAQSTKRGPKGRTLPPYMVFRYAAANAPHNRTRQSSTLAWDITSDGVEEAEAIVVDQVATRPLVLLFGWMLSKNSHLEKYRDFWIRRGYDILTVQTSPMDLLLPAVGGQKVARNVYNFLSKISPRYDEVLVHAFSVGGYQLGEFLGRLYEGVERDEPEAERLFRSLKGFLIDSVVFAEDAPPGLSRAITLNPIVQPVIEKSISGFLAATRPFTFARYKVVEAHIIDNLREVPSMLLFSKDDVVSNWRSNYKVVEGWQKKGITTKATCWDRSAHVLHYKEHPEEYEAEVDSFVRKLAITKAPRRG